MLKLAIDQFLFKLVCIFYGDLLYKSANQELLYPIEANRNYSAILATLQITSYALGV